MPFLKKAWIFANWRTHSDFYDMCVLAKVQKDYLEMYMRCLKITKRNATSALRVPTSKENKIRAVIMRIYPKMIPLAMKARRLKYHVNVCNR